jgi:hypothetical protein
MIRELGTRRHVFDETRALNVQGRVPIGNVEGEDAYDAIMRGKKFACDGDGHIA